MTAVDNSASWTFAYNADGLRTSKTNGTTTYQYIYLSDQLSQMTVDGHTLYFSYDANGSPLSVTYDGAYYYYVTNLQGDIVSILDNTGSEVVHYVYDAWGNILSATDNTEINLGFYNPLRYRGYVYDEETGLYYLQTRYYNPARGRFINGDCLIDNRGINTQNVFQYCGNNPINNADSSGNLFGAIAVGFLFIGLVVTLSSCSSEPATSTPPATSASSIPSKPSIPPTSVPETTPPHVPTTKEKVYAATVYAEAGGQNLRSKQAVAHVMNNRIGTRESWSDIEAVLSAKYQFSGFNSPMYQAAMNYYNNGICDNPIDQAAMDECLAVVIPIYSGEAVDITGGALYFHSLPNASDWKYHNAYEQVYVAGTEKFWFYR